MGEMADFVNDGAPPAGDDWEDFQGQDRERVCMYCGARRLHWAMHDTGWRLFDQKGNLHSCLEFRD